LEAEESDIKTESSSSIATLGLTDGEKYINMIAMRWYLLTVKQQVTFIS